MGSTISTYALGIDNGLKNRKNIKAMIAVQPLPYQNYIDALGLPKFSQRPVVKLNHERTGVDMVEKSFLPNVTDIDVLSLAPNHNTKHKKLPLIVAKRKNIMTYG